MGLHFVNKDSYELIEGSISPLPYIDATSLSTETAWNTFLDEILDGLKTQQMRTFSTVGSIDNSDGIPWICRCYKTPTKIYIEALGVEVAFGDGVEYTPLHYIKYKSDNIWSDWTQI